MKRFLLSITIFAFIATPISYLHAGGPKWMKNATKSLLTLYAIQQKGDTLQSNAFYLDDRGTVVAPFKSIQSALSAWVVDNEGNRIDVSRIEGFNSTYDVVRLKTKRGKKKSVFLPVCTEAATVGTPLYLMPKGDADEVVQVEKAGEYGYYTLKSKAEPQLAGFPVINESGTVSAIVQTPILTSTSPCYALDIRFVQGLSIRPMDANHSDLRNCHIPKQLPNDEAQATSFLYIVSATNTDMLKIYIEDFIKAFPKSITGYIQKAETEFAAKHYEAAEQAYKEGLAQQTGHDDELYYSRSRCIYNAVLSNNGNDTETHTLSHALTDISEAQRIHSQPLYTLHEAHILFAMKRFDEAYNKYMAVAQSKMRSAETFMYAWQCKRNMGGDDKAALAQELLTLNDSAMACFSKPYNLEAAPYLLLRSNTLTEMGRLRDAITDLNDYEHLMQGRLTAQFYYQREQLEVKTRMYGPAVNDMQKAISLSPDESVYHAELASLLYRLNDLESATAECRKAIELDDTFPDAYRLLGICLREKGDKAGAKRNLQKAIDLGDELAKGILEKIK